MKRKLGYLLSVMLVMSLISYGIVKSNQANQVINEEKKEELVIVTSFYPMYVATLNIVDGIEGITVINLTENQTGCVHDYQLTTKDMREIVDADIAIMNGGEMETFMEKVIADYPKLNVIIASEGIEFLEGVEHAHSEHAHADNNIEEADHDYEESESQEVEHDHDHEESESQEVEHDHDHEESESQEVEHDHDHEDSESQEVEHDHDHEDSESHEAEHDHDHELGEIIDIETGNFEVEHTHNHGSINGHVWMNMVLYQQQVATIARYLGTYDPANAAAYNKNAQDYIDKIEDLKREFDDISKMTKGKEIVLFHDSFAYLALQLDMEVVQIVNSDSESALSAGEIAEVINEVKLHSISYLFTEEQHSTAIADRVATETSARVYTLDSLVTGTLEKDAYLKGMRKNLEILKEAMNAE